MLFQTMKSVVAQSFTKIVKKTFFQQFQQGNLPTDLYQKLIFGRNFEFSKSVENFCENAAQKF